MTATLPETAMILAAGLGQRMRPLTENTPKALIKVAGKTLIDRSLDRLEEAGVKKIVVNVHYLAGQLESHLKARNTKTEIIFSDERGRLLETGGGILHALPLLGNAPFFAINCDIIWQDGEMNTLHRLADCWSDPDMDALLLMVPTNRAVGYDGAGDFHMDPDNRLIRREKNAVVPNLFGGVQILHPRLFHAQGPGPFSLNRLYDQAIETERLFGMRHEGNWMHVGAPAHITEAEALIRDQE